MNDPKKVNPKKATVPIGTQGRPKVYTKAVSYGLAWSANFCDLAADVKFRSTFCQITNYGEATVRVRLNSNNNAVFSLAGGDQKTFDKLVIGSVAFMHTDSGSTEEDIPVEVIFGY